MSAPVDTEGGYRPHNLPAPTKANIDAFINANIGLTSKHAGAGIPSIACLQIYCSVLRGIDGTLRYR